MRRLDALRAAYPLFQDAVVVTIMGAVAAELQSLGHRPNFFYLQHAMGLASSMGLGIALARPELKVVVFDGDGSVLMNLGGLTTLARYRPRNLVHVVFDNESLLSVGGFPTATATGSDIAGIAAAAGVPRTATVGTLDDFGRKVRERQPDGTSVVTAYCFLASKVGDISSNSADCPTPAAAEIPADAVSFTHSEPRLTTWS